MTEEEYWASEMRDSDLDAAAAGGEYFLEESGFSMMPTLAEMQQMAQEGEIILLRATGWLRSRRLQVAQGMLLDRKRLTSCIVIEDAEFESGTHSSIVTDAPLRAPDYSNRLTKPGGT